MNERNSYHDVAEALGRINDQLAIQNRRRRSLWKVVAWVIGLFAAFNVLLMALSFAVSAQDTGTVENHVTTVGESVVLEEAE